jgi:hypothetical protein
MASDTFYSRVKAMEIVLEKMEIRLNAAYMANVELVLEQESLKAQVETLEDNLFEESAKVVALQEVVDNFFHRSDREVQRELLAEFNMVEQRENIDLIEDFDFSDSSSDLGLF